MSAANGKLFFLLWFRYFFSYYFGGKKRVKSEKSSSFVSRKPFILRPSLCDVFRDNLRSDDGTCDIYEAAVKSFFTFLQLRIFLQFSSSISRFEMTLKFVLDRFTRGIFTLNWREMWKTEFLSPWKFIYEKKKLISQQQKKNSLCAREKSTTTWKCEKLIFPFHTPFNSSFLLLLFCPSWGDFPSLVCAQTESEKSWKSSYLRLQKVNREDFLCFLLFLFRKRRFNDWKVHFMS